MNDLDGIAREIRKLTINQIAHLGIGHIGGSMSIVEVLTVLYFKVMDVDPNNPQRADRDRFILSKGHAGPALYSTLAERGFFPRDWLHTLNKPGTNLPSHCDRQKTPGVDMTTGPLGQGLSLANGIALGMRLDKLDRYVYVVCGDGELQEGQNWEAAMSAAHFQLDNLIAFTDYNKMQIDGMTSDIMEMDDLVKRWEGFNWHVQRIDGHDVDAIETAIAAAKAANGKPSMIILDTIKGKGFSLADGKVGSHNMPISMDDAKVAIAALDVEDGY